MKAHDQTPQIDDYLSGDLSENEFNKFETMIAQNEKLADEVRFQEEIFEAIKDGRKRDIRQTLNQIHLENTRKPRINIHSWKLRAVAAAFVVLLIGGGLLSSYLTNQPINQKLYSEYFTPESSVLATRSGETSNPALKTGMFYYEQGKFTEAISVFASEPDNMLGKLYTGFSFMKLEKFEKAETPFIEIIDDNDNLFVDQAEWNLGLCYLRNGEALKAENQFVMISRGTTVYRKNANQILRKLNNKK